MTVLPLRARELIAFVPSSFSEKPVQDGDTTPAPTYYIAVPSVFDRAVLQREMITFGAHYPPDDVLYDKLAEAIRELVMADQQEELVAVVEAMRDCKSEPDEALHQQYVSIEEQFRAIYPPYASMVAARVHYSTLYRALACQMFLKKVENVGFSLEFERGKLTDACLAKIPLQDMAEVGQKAVTLMYLGPDAEKNSGPQSS